MKKEINHAGKVISVLAYDHNKEFIEHNRSLHEEIPRQKRVWRIVIMYDGKLVKDWDDLTDQQLRVNIHDAEKFAISYLDSIKSENKQSVKQFLKENGYSE